MPSAPELDPIGSPTSSRAGSAIPSAGSSWELVGAESEVPPFLIAGQAPSLPEGGERILAMARCGGPLLVFLWTLLTVVRDPPSEESEFGDEEDYLPELSMPVEVWSRRYLRRSATDGVEVFLVRRKSGTCLVVLQPDLSMGTITITAKSTLLNNPLPGVRWQPMPVLSQAQRGSFMAQATDGLRAGTIPALELHRLGRQAQQAVAANLAYAALKYLGVVDLIWGTATAVRGWMVTCKDAFVESSETPQEWVVYLGEWVERARKLMPLRRWAAILLALGLLMARGVHEMQETGELLATQLSDLAASQQATMGEISEMRAAERTRELRRGVLESSAQSRGRSGAGAKKQVVEGMMGCRSVLVRCGYRGFAGEDFAILVAGDAGEAAATSPPEAVELPMKRMRFKAQMPQQLFLEQLDEREEIPSEEWNSRMPEGCRQRIAAEAPSEIYASGKTADAWARDFNRDRGLSDCNAAREMIAAFAAVDAMLMTDRQEGPLNLVGFERLVRKGHAIVGAYRDVNCRDDWGRPRDAKGWKSRVDWEAARRLDPQLADESAIRVRSAEEEVKKAMGRGAQLIKVVLPQRSERPSLTSRRALTRWKEEVEMLGRANRFLLELRQLYRGSLDDSLLELAECWGRGPMPDNLGGDLSRRVLGEVRRQQPPPTTPCQGAAILRLRAAASAAGNQSRSTFKEWLAELRRWSAGGSARLPDRGDAFPTQWDRDAPPPLGARPAKVRSASPRAARKLEKFKEVMLREDGDACVQACEVRNFVDPHFGGKKEMLQLAWRMALVGVLCRTAEKVNEVGLFCAVKKAEVVGGEPEEMKEDGVTIRFGTGDLPDFYDTLEPGEEIAPYFALLGVRGGELDATSG
ncbi:unnamed protein product [Prorocentrum cordatum]|uniref:Uncharacterized protein n=1 Tax=Prorocentrum cordatum TaxID=2364126 RepID=A0ABN9SAJ3_9DINO|nr:unnamed protein product [Polarella glacialis]